MAGPSAPSSPGVGAARPLAHVGSPATLRHRGATWRSPHCSHKGLLDISGAVVHRTVWQGRGSWTQFPGSFRCCRPGAGVHPTAARPDTAAQAPQPVHLTPTIGSAGWSRLAESPWRLAQNPHGQGALARRMGWDCSGWGVPSGSGTGGWVVLGLGLQVSDSMEPWPEMQGHSGSASQLCPSPALPHTPPGSCHSCLAIQAAPIDHDQIRLPCVAGLHCSTAMVFWGCPCTPVLGL